MSNTSTPPSNELDSTTAAVVDGPVTTTSYQKVEQEKEKEEKNMSDVSKPHRQHPKRSPSETEALRAKLVQFYEEHNPAELHKVETALELDLSDEELWELLETKYEKKMKKEEKKGWVDDQQQSEPVAADGKKESAKVGDNSSSLLGKEERNQEEVTVENDSSNNTKSTTKEEEQTMVMNNADSQKKEPEKREVEEKPILSNESFSYPCQQDGGNVSEIFPRPVDPTHKKDANEEQEETSKKNNISADVVKQTSSSSDENSISNEKKKEKEEEEGETKKKISTSYVSNEDIISAFGFDTGPAATQQQLEEGGETSPQSKQAATTTTAVATHHVDPNSNETTTTGESSVDMNMRFLDELIKPNLPAPGSPETIHPNQLLKNQQRAMAASLRLRGISRFDRTGGDVVNNVSTTDQVPKPLPSNMSAPVQIKPNAIKDAMTEATLAQFSSKFDLTAEATTTSSTNSSPGNSVTNRGRSRSSPPDTAASLFGSVGGGGEKKSSAKTQEEGSTTHSSSMLTSGAQSSATEIGGSPSANNTSAGPISSPAVTLPKSFTMPTHLRCDFDVKFDSVCSKCHFKWKAMVETKRKQLCEHYANLPPFRRMSIFFASIARGTADFVEAILDHQPKCFDFNWLVEFQPLPSEIPKLTPKFLSSGRVFPLHVAFAYHRLEVAEMMLKRGCPIRWSDSKTLPTEYLLSETVKSLPDEWENMLSSQEMYIQHTMAMRARRLRIEHCYNDALSEYASLLKLNPSSESALCGLAKMFFDQGEYTKCANQCDYILSPMTVVQYLEFSPETVKLLRQQAIFERHRVCHLEQEGGAKKQCGCIVTDFTVFSLRCLPFPLVRNHILPFCQGMECFEFFKATQIPLLKEALTTVASYACDRTLGLMLSNEFGYAEMYDSIRLEPPTHDKYQFGSVEQFIGVEVIAMGDFHTFILRASSMCQRIKLVPSSSKEAGSKTKRSWFGRSDNNKQEEVPTTTKVTDVVKVTKLFRINRAAIGKAWDIHAAGEWEIDEVQGNYDI